MHGLISHVVWPIFAAIALSAVISTLWLSGITDRQGIWSKNDLSRLNDHSFLSGWICGLLFIPFIKNVTSSLFRYCFKNSGEDKLYGLDHALLNIEMPPPTMWMNMGYWKHTRSFPEACTALLKKVLRTAGLLDSNGSPLSVSDSSTLRIIDVGCGCGDQTVYLMKCLSRIDGQTPGSERRPLFDDYVGINVNEQQAKFARQRIKNTGRSGSIHIFCADAADPSSWSRELKDAVTATSQQGFGDKQSQIAHTWLLALDTLYHFKPSHDPLLSYAARKLSASFMAFDLILADSVHPVDYILLRVVCFMSSIPFSNFKTLSDYRDMLVKAGYASDNIEIHDISEYVFSGIGRYMEQREAELRRFKLSLGKLRAAGKLFSWWGRNNIVRGVVVVARRTAI